MTQVVDGRACPFRRHLAPVTFGWQPSWRSDPGRCRFPRRRALLRCAGPALEADRTTHPAFGKTAAPAQVATIPLARDRFAARRDAYPGSPHVVRAPAPHTRRCPRTPVPTDPACAA